MAPLEYPDFIPQFGPQICEREMRAHAPARGIFPQQTYTREVSGQRMYLHCLLTDLARMILTELSL